MARSKLTVLERFLTFVSPEPNSGCWLWLGQTGEGYGRMQRPAGLSYMAHRIAYEEMRGPIPEGLEIDHLCRVRCCVNPDHLEAVTKSENIRRGVAGIRAGERMRAKTHCPQGHPYNEENTHIRTGIHAGGRECIACTQKRSVDNWAVIKAARGPTPPRKPRTHCLRGHELAPDNTLSNSSGRQCRICIRNRENARNKKLSAARGSTRKISDTTHPGVATGGNAISGFSD
jgi:hypothetical protein